jgi:hypothetical protein
VAAAGILKAKHYQEIWRIPRSGGGHPETKTLPWEYGAFRIAVARILTLPREFGAFRVAVARILTLPREYGAFRVAVARILTLPREYGAFRVAVARILSTGEGAEREIAVGAAVLALSKVTCHVKCLKVSVRVLFLSNNFSLYA